MDLFTSKELLEKWDEWKMYQTSEKRQRNYTKKGEARSWKHLNKLSSNTDLISIQIIDQSMNNQYMGLFALKTNNNGFTINQQSTKLGTSEARIAALKRWGTTGERS